MRNHKQFNTIEGKANDLGVSKPSVSVAMKNLRNGEYIEMDKEGYITLLDKGREIADMQ